MFKNNPNKIILHCSDTEDSGDRYGLEDIDEWHRQRKFKDSVSGVHCGYHYVIRRSGLVEVGRPETSMGAHCKGYNENTLGICYVGRAKMTVMQIEAFISLFNAINMRHEIKYNDVYGHYEFTDNKTCPNQDMSVIRALLEREQWS